MSSWRDTIAGLFLTHRRRLERSVRARVGNADIAAEIVQDVFLRTLMAPPRASDEEGRRLLYAAARNAAIEHYRSETRRSRILQALLPEQLGRTATTSGEDHTSAREALATLEKSLADLSPRCREIFLQRRVEGLSNAEIARHHGISVNSVEKHIARALQHCAARLSGYLGDE
ncbi:RNA polymerase sigma factor [Paracoccus aminophilus]|uniref:FecI family ECF sigma factor n=1 Tax=Paracoccus aminophilus JCM 7686 TaxID=1367847 RepID=S5Y0R6_PARAH|nr:RNA polymerase sigma factor [Paracoccus aminophilus]AGT11082.1 FecI family ECF sigma factor [Paracoccus aminophilus JCM 7686]